MTKGLISSVRLLHFDLQTVEVAVFLCSCVQGTQRGCSSLAVFLLTLYVFFAVWQPI